jgi:hypothetical protein
MEKSFAPSRASQAALKGGSGSVQVETRSPLFAVVAGVLGFKPSLKSVTPLKRKNKARGGQGALSETGDLQYVFTIPPSVRSIGFDGGKHDYRSNNIRYGLTEKSSKGRLCLLDDQYPEHPALYAAQTLLNHRALQRCVEEGAPLYQYTWDHTTRTALINDDKFHPFSYLLDEMKCTCGALKGRHESSVLRPTGLDVTELVGASEMMVTNSDEVAASLSACGFTVTPQARDGRAVFVVSPKARVTSASTQKEGSKFLSAVWDAEKIRDLISSPSNRGRANALEDADPEHPVLYGANSIVGKYDLVESIVKGPSRRTFKIISDKTTAHAYIQEKNAAAFDKLKSMFRRSGSKYGQPKLI